MYCKDCGEKLSTKDAKFCASCGKGQGSEAEVKTSVLHWGPVIIFIVGLMIFGSIGGDIDLYEVNIFDYVAGIMGIAGLVMTFLVIPKERLGLYITPIVLNSLLALGALGWILSYGF